MDEFLHNLFMLALLIGGISALYQITVKPVAQLTRKRIKGNKKEHSNFTNNAMDKNNYETRDLVKKTLESIGCQYEIKEDDYICFKYQGEVFNIAAKDDNDIICIYDIGWASYDMNDPNADNLKSAVNKANRYAPVTKLYTTDEEKHLIILHCQMAIYFVRIIPDRKEYLATSLNSFFTAHQQVRDEFADLCKSQEQKRRTEIKGFRA